MDLTPLSQAGQAAITAYRPGGFRVGGVPYEGSVLVFPDRVLPWAVADIAALTLDALGPVVDAEAGVDILLIGCGARMAPLTALKRALRDQGIGADPMDTGAACRTFNLLLAERRRVAAALIAL